MSKKCSNVIGRIVQKGSSFFHFGQTKSDKIYAAVRLSVVIESFRVEDDRLFVEVYGFPEKYRKDKNRFLSLTLKMPVRKVSHRHEPEPYN